MRRAVYKRKSIEEGLEQAFNSLDAQRESAEAYKHGALQEGLLRCKSCDCAMIHAHTTNRT